MPMRRGKSTNFIGMEAAMKRSRVATTAIPLLIGIGLLLSACADRPGYRGGYGDPAHGSVSGGGWEGRHHGFFHGHFDGRRDFGHEGFEGHRGFGHGFTGHAGFGGHDGGVGHGGGGNDGGGGHGRAVGRRGGGATGG